MLIHPWDAATSEDEWRRWLAEHEPFGVLAVANLDPDEAPLVLPLHLSLVDTVLVAHLARTNPVWPHLERATRVRVAFHGDYAFIPGYWRAPDATAPADGVPTSYYSAVQFICRPRIVDDPEAKAAILERQLGDLQPEGRHAAVVPGEPPYGTMLGAIRALELEIVEVSAKFKYDDQKPVELRDAVSAALIERDHGLDRAAASQQRRRLALLGAWRTHARSSAPSSDQTPRA